jgi:hypothetical protein
MPSTRTLTLAAAALAVGTAPLAAQSLGGAFDPVNEFGEERLTGQAAATMAEGAWTFTIKARGFSPGMHMAHLHGFPTEDPQEARCPTMEADANGDGYVDLIETRDMAGVTLIPLSEDPAALSLQVDTYPVVGEDGSLDYAQEVDAQMLLHALREDFGTLPAIESRVVMIHGAPKGVDLPDTVQSLKGVPAEETIPIACAELNAS